MPTLIGGIFITTKDVMVLHNCSRRQAQRELQTLRDILQIPYRKVSVNEYCEYWKISYDEVVNYLNPFRKK